jgi:hypothetical protein
LVFVKTYRTIILPVVLYGCETWVKLREKRRLMVFENGVLRVFENRVLRVFENRVLRGILGPKRDEVTGDWRQLHNEELHDLYCSSNIVRVIKARRIRWVGHVVRIGENRVIFSVWVGKPEGKRPMGGPRR